MLNESPHPDPSPRKAGERGFCGTHITVKKISKFLLAGWHCFELLSKAVLIVF